MSVSKKLSVISTREKMGTKRIRSIMTSITKEGIDGNGNPRRSRQDVRKTSGDIILDLSLGIHNSQPPDIEP